MAVDRAGAGRIPEPATEAPPPPPPSTGTPSTAAPVSKAPRSHCSPWILALVADVEYYEATHPAVHDGDSDFCLSEALSRVPTEIRAQAAGYAIAVQERAR